MYSQSRDRAFFVGTLGTEAQKRCKLLILNIFFVRGPKFENGTNEEQRWNKPMKRQICKILQVFCGEFCKFLQEF